jgi:hypothetical protein
MSKFEVDYSKNTWAFEKDKKEMRETCLLISKI